MRRRRLLLGSGRVAGAALLAGLAAEMPKWAKAVRESGATVD